MYLKVIKGTRKTYIIYTIIIHLFWDNTYSAPNSAGDLKRSKYASLDRAYLSLSGSVGCPSNFFFGLLIKATLDPWSGSYLTQRIIDIHRVSAASVLRPLLSGRDLNQLRYISFATVFRQLKFCICIFYFKYSFASCIIPCITKQNQLWELSWVRSRLKTLFLMN